MLLKEFISGAVKALESLYAEQEARSVVSGLCEGILGVKGYTHIVSPEYQIDPGALPGLEAAMERLLSGEPLQYVLGYAGFYGYRFKVSPSVLIPRPETELLCRYAEEEIQRITRMRRAYGGPPVRVLDLCTGSGCIAWTLALSVPGIEVVAVDISQDALDIASGQDFSRQLKESGASAPIFLKADVLDFHRSEGLSGEDAALKLGLFDIILSNPPYVRESEKTLMRHNVTGFEPAIALYVPDEDPLVFYRAIAEWGSALLTEEGTGFVEINEAFGPETETVFRKSGFSGSMTMKDFCSKNRFIRFSK